MIDGKSYLLEKGESIVMPANRPHAVYGEEDFKMMLVVVFSPMQFLTFWFFYEPPEGVFFVWKRRDDLKRSIGNLRKGGIKFL